MKILLIHPYVTTESLHECHNLVLTEPLGLACLASCLQDYDVEILDLFALGFTKVQKIGHFYRKGLSDYNRIVRLIDDFNPKIIGITCNFTSFAPDAYEIAKLVKDNFKDRLVILGGAHVTIDAENILENNPAADIIVRGEGEVTLKKLVEAIENGEDLGLVDGISYRKKDGRVKSNPSRKLIENLDSLPFPDRKKLSMEFYLKVNSLAMPFAKREPVASILTSRGCPYECIFCSTKVMWERKWRPKSAEKLIEEIEMLMKIYGAREIAIMDDQFMLDRNRVNSICDLIIEKSLNITLTIPPGTSVWLADERLLKKMKKAGFYRLCFPIETGNQETLKFIRKPVNLTKAKKTVELANQIGIWTQGNFIIGFPYETRDEIQDTINYAFQSGLDYVIFYVAKPYAGAEMYEIFKKEGLLTDVARGSNLETANYDTKTVKASELQYLRDKASRQYLFVKLLFYLPPSNFYKYLLPKILSKENFLYAVKIAFRIIKKTLRQNNKKYVKAA